MYSDWRAQAFRAESYTLARLTKKIIANIS
jgi:hypothetical protein